MGSIVGVLFGLFVDIRVGTAPSVPVGIMLWTELGKPVWMEDGRIDDNAAMVGTVLGPTVGLLDIGSVVCIPVGTKVWTGESDTAGAKLGLFEGGFVGALILVDGLLDGSLVGIAVEVEGTQVGLIVAAGNGSVLGMRF